MTGHAGAVRIVAFRPDGRRVASGGADRTVRIWDPATGRLLETVRSHQTPIAGLAYSPDGRRIASADEDGPIRVWEPEANETDGRSLHGHPQGVSRLPFIPDQARRLAFSPDGTMLASLGTTSDVRLWDVSDAGDPRVLRGHTAQVYPVAFSPDGRWIASGGWDQTVRLWDAASGRPAAAMEHASSGTIPTSSSRWPSARTDPGSPRGPGSARSESGTPATGRLLQDLDHPGRKRSGFVHELAFSPDGTRLYAGNDDRLACWDARTGRELPALPLPLRETRIVAFRPDGRRLAAAGKGDDLVIVDPADGRVIVRLRHDGGPIEAVRFSPDGRRLATGGESGDVRLWDADTGSLLRTFRSHTGEVFAVAWHPDGTPPGHRRPRPDHPDLGPGVRRRADRPRSGIPRTSSRWPSAPTARPWYPARATPPSGSGTPFRSLAACGQRRATTATGGETVEASPAPGDPIRIRAAVRQDRTDRTSDHSHSV